MVVDMFGLLEMTTFVTFGPAFEIDNKTFSPADRKVKEVMNFITANSRSF